MINRPADAPAPGADRAPFVRRRLRLALFQREANHAAGPLIGPIGLNVGVAECGITPAPSDQLADRIKNRSAGFRRCLAGLGAIAGLSSSAGFALVGSTAAATARWKSERDAQQHWYRPARLR